jgi:hypothetical protein
MMIYMELFAAFTLSLILTELVLRNLGKNTIQPKEEYTQNQR